MSVSGKYAWKITKNKSLIKLQEHTLFRDRKVVCVLKFAKFVQGMRLENQNYALRAEHILNHWYSELDDECKKLPDVIYKISRFKSRFAQIKCKELFQIQTYMERGRDFAIRFVERCNAANYFAINLRKFHMFRWDLTLLQKKKYTFYNDTARECLELAWMIKRSSFRPPAELFCIIVAVCQEELKTFKKKHPDYFKKDVERLKSLANKSLAAASDDSVSNKTPSPSNTYYRPPTQPIKSYGNNRFVKSTITIEGHKVHETIISPEDYIEYLDYEETIAAPEDCIEYVDSEEAMAPPESYIEYVGDNEDSDAMCIADSSPAVPPPPESAISMPSANEIHSSEPKTLSASTPLADKIQSPIDDAVNKIVLKPVKIIKINSIPKSPSFIQALQNLGLNVSSLSQIPQVPIGAKRKHAEEDEAELSSKKTNLASNADIVMNITVNAVDFTLPVPGEMRKPDFCGVDASYVPDGFGLILADYTCSMKESSILSFFKRRRSVISALSGESCALPSMIGFSRAFDLISSSSPCYANTPLPNITSNRVLLTADVLVGSLELAQQLHEFSLRNQSSDHNAVLQATICCAANLDKVRTINSNYLSKEIFQLMAKCIRLYSNTFNSTTLGTWFKRDMSMKDCYEEKTAYAVFDSH